MKLRDSYVLFAAVAFTGIALGVAALTYFSRDRAPRQTAAAPARPTRVVVARLPAPPPASGAALPSMLHSPPPIASAPAAPAQTVEEPPFPTGTVVAPGADTPEVEGMLSFPPAPPPRPADLAKITPPAPLPPSRPRDLLELASLNSAPPESAPQAQAPAPEPQTVAPAPEPPTAEAPASTPAPNAPLPPTRPRELAALSPSPTSPSPTQSDVVPVSAPPPAADAAPAASALEKLARLNEPALRPAPDDAFQQQAPVRFGMGDPVFIRIFKQEGQLELYLHKNGRYALYKNYPICKWSGRLGPKIKEADYQSPEGFYSVSARQLHPHSNYHRAFNVGYPNAFDKQNGRTGGLVMVHGACKSVGCFAMTDQGIEEIYGFVEAALRAGQKEIGVHIFPFRMTDANIARETGGGWLAFVGGPNHAQWSGFRKNLKQGYDLFEQSGEPPSAFACGDHYEFNGGGASCRRVAGW